MLEPTSSGQSIELRGELAGMLRLGGMREPGALAGLVEQVKLVAGARNHRESFPVEIAI